MCSWKVPLDLVGTNSPLKAHPLRSDDRGFQCSFCQCSHGTVVLTTNSRITLVGKRLSDTHHGKSALDQYMLNETPSGIPFDVPWHFHRVFSFESRQSDCHTYYFELFPSQLSRLSAMYSLLPGYFMDKIQSYIRSVQTLFNLSTAKSAVEFKDNADRDPGHSRELSSWHRVNSELKGLETVHHQFWWSKQAGKGLAVLLHHAGYPQDLQYRDLKFFAEIVAPRLGVSAECVGENSTRWPSFMTDDGTPLELSWDWGTTDQPPTIRYSIEPIGLHAGGPLDTNNRVAGPALQQDLIHTLPDMRLEWFNHFQNFLNPHKEDIYRPVVAEDHNTSIFYAFDLSAARITVKTYFFPKFRANASRLSNLDILSQAIQSAPYVTQGNLEAWSLFHDFSCEPQNIGLEHEMLAIDHIDPLESRLKIYFRNRETSFSSVINVMTLGGRISNPKLYQGLKDLHRLWNAVFEVDAGPDESLPHMGHRTAGILYNVEFKLGDTIPIAKIYLPVRHYSSSDDAILRGLNQYFKLHDRGKYMPQYLEAMRMLL